MNLRQLKTLVELAETGSFSAAGRAVGLSHSAVSLHVKALEEELNVQLVDRSRRPPALTNRGLALVERARRMIDLMDEIAGLGSEESLIGRLAVGVVPTALVDLLPPALAALRSSHPRLQIRISTGLSGDLAHHVRTGEIDVAVATAPDLEIEGLVARPILKEPLFLVAPGGTRATDPRALLTGYPFIWFSRKTWAGQQIERRLRDARITVDEAMEVDSLDAIISLVRHGLGVSIVPWRAARPGLTDGLTALPFGDPQHHRVLALLERPRNPKSRLADALLDELVAISRAQSA